MWYNTPTFVVFSYMIDPRNILLWVIAIGNIALGLLIGFKDRKNVVNRAFGNFAIAIAVWSFAIIAFRSVEDEELSLFAIKFSYRLGCIIYKVAICEYMLSDSN